MSKLKHASLYATPLLLLIVLTTLWTQVLKPLAVSFIIQQIPKVNSAQDIIYIDVEKIDLSILKLQLRAQGIKIKFKNKSENKADSLSPLLVNNIIAQLDIFDLIVGQINISKVIIDSAHWTYDIKTDNLNNKISVPVDTIFKYLNIIPVDHVIFYNSDLQLTTPRPQSESQSVPQSLIKLQIPQLFLSNRKTELSLSVKQLSVDISQNKKNAFPIETDFNFSLKKNELNINEFTLRTLDSQIRLTAQLLDVVDIGKLISHPRGQIKFNSKINLQDLRTILLVLVPQKKRLPSVSGFINSSGVLNLNTYDNIKGTVDINTTQVMLDQFKLGQAKINANIKNSQIEISEIKFEHPSGKVSLKNVKIDKTPPYRYSTTIEISNFDLQKLFISLSLNNIPAGFMASGKAACTGAIQANTIATCSIQAALENIWVNTAKTDNFNILKLKQGHLTGETKFTKEGFSYQSNVQIGNSKGLSSGQVDFKKGFDINFETDRLDCNDVESFADMNINGELKIRGSARGDSGTGTVKADISMNNAEIDDFRLGHFASILEYKNTNLKFSQLTSTVGKSEISGFLNFNFINSTLEGSLNSTKLNGEDIFYILDKKFSLPFEFTGSGKADLLFNGPFNFWKLKYDLKSEFNNGVIGNENYSHIDLNLIANGDTILFRNVHIKKLKSDFLLEGFINTIPTKPQLNLKIKANPFLLEEIDHIVSYAPAISGTGYAEGQITGPLDFPKLYTNFTLQQVSYDKVDYPNSQGRVTIDKNYLNFNGQLFGRQIQSDLSWPWNTNDSFSAKILVHDLNPLFLLPLVSIPQPSAEFSSKLNAEIDLVSKNRSLSSAEGYIKITDFLLKRGSQSLKLEKTSRLVFKSGLKQMEKLVLKGEDGFLSLELIQGLASQARLNIVANLQLRLLHFLAPFVQSLSGNLVVDGRIILKNDQSFEMLGEGELTDAYIVMKGFPLAIESINTPIEFSKSKIFLNDITAKLGQSDVNGLGQIEILGPKNIQVNLRAVADNVELNFPDKILTAGKANLFFSGNWLPYHLKIDYKVSHGLVEKDFAAEKGQSSSLKASPFLPPKQIEQLAPSLFLDININATKGIIIKNKLIEGEVIGSLNISGSPESPNIKGKIDIKPGSKLIFKDKPFVIQTAQINFQESKKINPDLYISANARVSDYDINLLVQGPAKNPAIKATSQPPLTEPDLFSLLALGVTSQTDQNLSSDTQQKQTGLEVLAALSNQSQFNKKIQEKLGLTVQLAPSIDSTKNIAVPKVVVSKKLSEKFNASYSKPFTGNDQNQEIKLQYLYNNNISLLLNYQNKDTIQQDQISNTNTNTKGIWGLDLEYRDEFK